jgi:hypothetical protein
MPLAYIEGAAPNQWRCCRSNDASVTVTRNVQPCSTAISYGLFRCLRSIYTVLAGVLHIVDESNRQPPTLNALSTLALWQHIDGEGFVELSLTVATFRSKPIATFSFKTDVLT